MTEISFARSFLSALDMRPVKISSDHVADPRSFSPQSASYVLPKHVNQPTKRKRTTPSAAAPGSTPAEKTVAVVLKNHKYPSLSLALANQVLSTSVFDLKTAYAAQNPGLAVEKIKLLHSKKPVADSKSLKDVLGEAAEAARDVEFGVMVMGGVTGGPTPATMEDGATAIGGVGIEVLRTKEFWDDLRGFLIQKVQDEGESERLMGLFKAAWESGG
jgi:ubiquitin-like protein 4